MIAWIIGLGVPERFARPLLIALAVIAGIAVLCVAKCSYDRSVIERHDDARDAAIATQGRAGEAQASDERRADDARISNEKEEMHNATASMPDRAPSDRQRARACVILRQQARASGDPVPTGC